MIQAGNNSLESVADSCYRSLEQLDSGLLSTLEENIKSCVDGGNDNKMKEIGGLGDRLSGLEQLLLDAKKKVTGSLDHYLSSLSLSSGDGAAGLGPGLPPEPGPGQRPEGHQHPARPLRQPQAAASR